MQRDTGDIVIRNPSFEASGNPAGVGYVQPDNLAGWDFSGGGRGININGVGPFTDNGISSDQDRAVFLQSMGTVMSQNLSGFIAGQKYTLIYEVNARNCCAAPNVTSHRVSFADEAVVEEDITPVGPNNSYIVKYVVFTPTASDGILKFENTAEGDHTLLLDNVRIVKGVVTASEPAPALNRLTNAAPKN